MIKFILVFIILTTSVFGEKLNYVIIKQEKQRKGASLNPPLPAKYTLLIVKAALKGDKKLNKSNVTIVLKKILSDIKKNNKNIDGVTTYLYKSKRNFNDGSSSFAQIEWWPKNHSLSRKNHINIMNKTTYKTDIKIYSLPKEIKDKSIIVTKIPLSTRKEIFIAKRKSELKAIKNADKKYDPGIQWKQHLKEVEILQEKYSKQLCKKYKISKKELVDIGFEGIMGGW